MRIRLLAVLSLISFMANARYSDGKSECYVEKSFIAGQKDKEAKGFTADGASAIRFVYRSGYAKPDEKCDLKFYVDGSEVDETRAGIVESRTYGNDSIAVTLVSPENYPDTVSPEYKVTMKLTPYYSGNASDPVDFEYTVSRPGIVFVHGLGDSKYCWSGLNNRLVNEHKYNPYQIYRTDYRSTNTHPFDTNAPAVSVSCESLCRQMLENKGIASTKYDLVGHSMGGILSRLYVQDLKGACCTNKIITVNTPHLGSVLGNIAVYFGATTLNEDSTYNMLHDLLCMLVYKDDGNFGAIEDLAIGSDAIEKLNSYNVSELSDIPVHAVCTHFDESLFQSVQAPGLLLMFRLLEKLIAIPSVSSFVGDGVVGLPSQKAGLPDSCFSVFKGDIQAFHCNTPRWSAVQNQVTSLLLANKKCGKFSMSGFGTPPSATKGLAESCAYEDIPDFIDHFNDARDSSYIRCSIACISQTDSTYKAKIDVSADMSTFILFAIADDGTMFYSEDCPQPELDLSGMADETLKFYAVGRTDYDALVMDSVTLHTNTGLTDLSQSSPYTIYVNNGTVTLSITGSDKSASWNVYSLDATCICSGTTKDNMAHITNLKPGVHIIQITVDGRSRYEKVMIR